MCTVTGGCEAKRKESVESARGKEVCQTECPGAIVCAGTIMDGGGMEVGWGWRGKWRWRKNMRRNRRRRMNRRTRRKRGRQIGGEGGSSQRRGDLIGRENSPLWPKGDFPSLAAHIHAALRDRSPRASIRWLPCAFFKISFPYICEYFGTHFV